MPQITVRIINNPVSSSVLREGTSTIARAHSAARAGRGGGRGGGQGGGNQGSIRSSLAAAEIARGTRAKEVHAARLMADPAVFAVGVGEDPAAPGQPAVIVYADRGRARAQIARELDGVRTVVVETDPIVAYGWNQPMGGGGCESK